MKQVQDAYIVAATRTPIGRSHKGVFRNYRPDDLLAETLKAVLAQAPSLVFDHNDRLQERWVRRAVRKDVPLVAHRLPSTQAFVDACLAGLGWGMNPLHLVQAHLQAGRLVELVPERPLDVPLYWQCATLPLPTLDHLGQCVQRAAALALVR